MNKTAHLLYTPFTGLGLYGGYRGRRWLSNRIKIFKQFVLLSLSAQTDKDFILWVSWRLEDRNDKDVLDLKLYIEQLGIRNVFTYHGVAFWDDKYEDSEAYDRLINAIHGSMGNLINSMGECDTVLMTIQPSDDCYHFQMVEKTKRFFLYNPNVDVFGYQKGYVMDYTNGKVAEWNPTTTPPFYTIKFTKEVFIEPLKHIQFIGPYKSHEYLKEHMKTVYMDFRGFIVGVHGENISTVFNHPFTGAEVSRETVEDFGIQNAPLIEIPINIRRTIMRKLPFGWQKRLRYCLGERIFSKLYGWIRS